MNQEFQLMRNPPNPDSFSAGILPDELWQCIGRKLPVADRLRFRAVCKTWMSLIPSRTPPWLMLPEPKPRRQPSPPPRRHLVSLGEQSTYEFDLPELHDSRCVGSSGNWLITVHKDSTLRLLNPFDHRQIHLPSALLFDKPIVDTNIPEQFFLGKIKLWKVILNSSPSNSQDCIGMAIHGFPKALGFARLGDRKWTTVEVAKRVEIADQMEVDGQSIPFCVVDEVEDVVFYKQQFYVITNRGQLFVCDVGDGLVPSKVSNLCGPVEKSSSLRVSYLVEWLGELLMVRKSLGLVENGNNGLAYGTKKFEIYKFDFIYKKWSDLTSLGEHSLFLGLNTSVSFNASEYSGLVKKNCVYFTDNFLVGYIFLSQMFDNVSTPFGHDMGVFDLEDKCITPHFKGASTSTSLLQAVDLMSPPVWIVPPEIDSVFHD